MCMNGFSRWMMFCWTGRRRIVFIVGLGEEELCLFKVSGPTTSCYQRVQRQTLIDFQFLSGSMI